MNHTLKLRGINVCKYPSLARTDAKKWKIVRRKIELSSLRRLEPTS